MHKEKVTIGHGSGGRLTHDLVNKFVVSELGNRVLNLLDDSAVLKEIPKGYKLAFTTDSHVVDPIFFAGGDIGRLAVAGTVNDLAVSGAISRYLSLSFIIEDGFGLDDLKKIVSSIRKTAMEAGVRIVTGDTKVVPKGKGDKIFINTSGIGFIPEKLNLSTWNVKAGDKVIVSGSLGDHEIAILNAREELGLKTGIKSDVGPINKEIQKVLGKAKGIRCFKDLTRGGLAGALIEIAEHSRCEIKISEDKIPVKKEVAGACELLGLDPIYLANEGKFVVVCPESEVSRVLGALGKSATEIGAVLKKDPKGIVLMETLSGGVRRVHMMTSSQLPRIC